MPGVDLVRAERDRAKSLIHESQPTVGALQQALPPLLLLGLQYQSALRSYATLHLRQQDIQALGRIEDFAHRRYRLMQDRYFTARRSIDAIEQIRVLDYSIASANIAIAAGKTAELFISAGRWAKIAKSLVDDLKEVVDYTKAGAGIASAVDKQDAGLGALALTQLLAVRMRLDTNYERLTKLLWDGSGAWRRFHTMKDFGQALSSCVNLFKVLIDSFVSLVTWLEEQMKVPRALKNYSGLFKDFSVAVGIVRDAIDALRALYRAGEALVGVWRTYEAQQLAEREAAGYIGAGDVAVLDPNVAFAQFHPATFVAQATSVEAAKSLMRVAQDTARRIESDVFALDALYWREVIRLQSAHREISPQLNAATEFAKRINVQLTNLDIIVRRGGPRAEAAKPLVAALEGYRSYLLSLILQIEGIVVPDIPQPQKVPPLPRFDLDDASSM
jgi:hypothetical protein